MAAIGIITDDPVFKLIQAHRKAEARWSSYPGEAEDPEFTQLGDEVDELAWDLARCLPTTIEGVIALARHTSVDDEDGERWPDRNAWRCLLLRSIADALEHTQYL